MHDSARTRSLNISTKLGMLVFSVILGLVLIAVAMLISEQKILRTERENAVRQTVEVAHGIVNRYHDLSSKGLITEAEAKQQAMQAVKTLHYNGSEYFWINDMHPRMVMHPNSPALDGTDLTENRDPNGVRLFVEFVNLVKARGAGLVAYAWPKPGSDKPVPKISYVKGFAQWQWVIGSGVYVETVEAMILARSANVAIGSVVLIVILLGIGLLIARSVARPITHAVRIAETIAGGGLMSHIPVDTDNESGKLMQALKSMNESLAQIVGNMRGSTGAIATASRQMAADNLDLSSRTEEQASSLEQTAASMEQLTATVKQNSENARQASDLAMSASNVAAKGGSVVSQVVETMDSINGSSRQIADIIGVIDGIAF